MKGANEPRRVEVEIMDVAMQWLLRLRDESVTESDIAAWMDWYESDERHKSAFDEMQAFWRSTGELAALPGGAERIQRLRGVFPTLSRWSRPQAQVALAATILTAIALSFFFGQRFIDVSATRSVTAAAPLRERVLADGSRLQLAAKSVVEVRYTNSERRLELKDGEAHFTVAPNRNRPFIVRAGKLHVRAVGTAFNIRKAGERVVVTVDNGVVDVTMNGNTWRAEVGDQLALDPRSGELRKSATDPAGALAWREGRLEYIDEPLSAVIADVNRYAKQRVMIDDPRAGQLAFTGTVFTRNIEEWLRALPGEFPVKLVADGREALRMSSREVESDKNQ